MKIQDRLGDDESSINMTPMIDMVFLLLIFFLVATQFIQAERPRDVQLPGSASDDPLSEPPKSVIISITQETVDGEVRGIYRIGGTKYDLAAVEKLLRDVAKNHPDRDVLVRADRDSKHAFFAEVIDLAHRAGIKALQIGYLVESKD